MRIWRIFSLALCLFVFKAMAQKEFTLEDLNFGGENYGRFTPAEKTTAWWGDNLVLVGQDGCSLVEKKTGKETPLFSAAEISAATGAENPSLRGLSFPFADDAVCYVRTERRRVLYDFRGKKTVWSQEAGECQCEDFCPRTRRTAFLRDGQLCVSDAAGAVREITSDGDGENIIYGRAVHRDEFGIRKGTFWSPDGRRLAFYRMDQSMVAAYPQVNVTSQEGLMAALENDKYPMAGEKSHEVTVGVYDTATHGVTYLETGEPRDRYFTNLAWSPDGTELYMFELNRGQNDCRLTVWDAATGKFLREIYRETDEKYVEPLNPVTFLPWDGNEFVLQSRRDGWNHLYLYDVSGREIRQITSGPWEVMELIGFDEKSKSVIYAGNELSSMQRDIFKAGVASGRRTLLDCGRGWHQASLSSSGAYMADTYSAPDVPRRTDITNTRTRRRLEWFAAPDPWEGYDKPLFTAGEITAADDSTRLNYRMVLPPDFNAENRYPAVVYVYGGPHAHLVDASWHYGSRSWETYMAQKGFILFILDNRGGENRGKDFEQVTFHRLGREEMLDQMKGVEYLASLPYVDASRLGVHGWSFGGFMTISLMTNYPGVFKAGVAGGPVIDWRWYEVMYGERYMGTPESNPEGYRETSLLSRAGDLKDKLQIIIGYNDRTVVPQHSLSFINECILAGAQPDFFLYPGEPHNMTGHKSVHLHERITRYFEENLK